MRKRHTLISQGQTNFELMPVSWCQAESSLPNVHLYTLKLQMQNLVSRLSGCQSLDEQHMLLSVRYSTDFGAAQKPVKN